MLYTAVCVDLAKLEQAKPKPQNQLLLFAKCEPKSCAHECNYVVRLPIQPVNEVYHIIINVHSFLVHILQGQRKPVVVRLKKPKGEMYRVLHATLSAKHIQLPAVINYKASVSGCEQDVLLPIR